MEVLIVKELTRGSYGSTDQGGADPSRLPLQFRVHRASGLRRQGGDSFLLRNELKHKYS
jgi:hypothetical protein